jgi:hypothetical protein
MDNKVIDEVRSLLFDSYFSLNWICQRPW